MTFGRINRYGRKPKRSSKLRTIGLRMLGKTHFARPFKPGRNFGMEMVRAYLLGVRIRLLLACGFGVVVVGGSGTGKTFLLNQAFRGRVISPDFSLLTQTGIKPPLVVPATPGETFAIDELNYYEPQTILFALPDLRSKRLVLSVQTLRELRTCHVDKLFGERLVIIFLGTHDNWKRDAIEALSFEPSTLDGN